VTPPFSMYGLSNESNDNNLCSEPAAEGAGGRVERVAGARTSPGTFGMFAIL